MLDAGRAKAAAQEFAKAVLQESRKTPRSFTAKAKPPDLGATTSRRTERQL